LQEDFGKGLHVCEFLMLTNKLAALVDRACSCNIIAILPGLTNAHAYPQFERFPHGNAKEVGTAQMGARADASVQLIKFINYLFNKIIFCTGFPAGTLGVGFALSATP